MNILHETQQLVNELNDTNSKTEKIAILKRYPQCAHLLKLVYDPLKTFGVTSDVLKKREGVIASGAVKRWESTDEKAIYHLLELLIIRKITGYEAIDVVNEFIRCNSDYVDLIKNIIDKNLKVRIDEKSINKAFPGLIPTFSVALAHPFEKYAHAVDFDAQNYFISRKLDGCFKDDTNIQTSEGTKTIKEIVDQVLGGCVVFVKSYNEKTKKIEHKRVLNGFRNVTDVQEANKKTTWYKITTSDGRTLIATGIHRIFIPNLNCWRRVDEMDVNDQVLITV